MEAPESKTHSECDIPEELWATDLWKKQTLLVAAKRETSEIAQPKY